MMMGVSRCSEEAVHYHQIQEGGRKDSEGMMLIRDDLMKRKQECAQSNSTNES